MKKFISILLTFVMTLCTFTFAVSAEESENNGIPENATRHTIALTLNPEEIYSGEIGNGDNTASPYIWGDPSLSMADNHVAYTNSFYVSDRYFAFEMEGFLYNDAISDESYCVALEYVGAGVIASMSGYADRSLYKLDWIDIYSDGNYRFMVTNNTDYILTVYITYYSWN